MHNAVLGRLVACGHSIVIEIAVASVLVDRKLRDHRIAAVQLHDVVCHDQLLVGRAPHDDFNLSICWN